MTENHQVLVLHGNRQTGQLLLGRMDKLRKALQKNGLKPVAPDAPFPHPEDIEMRTWWNREENHYHGLEQTLDGLQRLWNSGSFVGILGFSQGARLAHLVAICHERQPAVYFPGLQFVLMVAGYDAPLPPELSRLVPSTSSSATLDDRLETPSMHVWGGADQLITPDQSIAVTAHYVNPVMYEHEGGHHVPMRAANVRAYVDFIEDAIKAKRKESGADDCKNSEKNFDSLNHFTATHVAPSDNSKPIQKPDDETVQTQQDEVEALSAIFPEEFTLVSKVSEDDNGAVYEHPIVYRIALPPSDEGSWPPQPIAIQVQYSYNYPQESLPLFRLEHENNVMQFSTAQSDGLLRAMKEAAQAEEGMPSVLSCVYAARDYFESGAMMTAALPASASEDEFAKEDEDALDISNRSVPKASSAERIQQANLLGLELARSILKRSASTAVHDGTASPPGKGGSWTYTIGLVGKPSAGKSTFFNVATAFARQRDDSDNALGGATMAPHPFTTINPNVGYCLVPAPDGSCPEEGYQGDLAIGSTHGRDNLGRRLLPVLLKDVAGLVPGAYQGRGRGNAFLNDLTDGDVLIHVLDASGTADTEGNAVMGSEQDGEQSTEALHPLNDLAWIRSELIEWVTQNLMFKWDTIERRGRSKLSDMFSGYGQTQAVTLEILDAVEKYLAHEEHRDHALDQLDCWDNRDIHLLVSTFLGVRFPMALALNKCDLPSSKKHVDDIQAALPAHGAYVGVPLCAKSEMTFIRKTIEAALGTEPNKDNDEEGRIPSGVWQCLQSALTQREPILVFPVCDMSTYAPLPGLNKYATEDPSLPSGGMINCLAAAGGSTPTLWDAEQRIYTTTKKSNTALRDVLVMKPGSTVEDVFLSLKRHGALGGEFVRAEGAGAIGEKPKLVPKYDVVSRSTRILKIMTSKRGSWQEISKPLT